MAKQTVKKTTKTKTTITFTPKQSFVEQRSQQAKTQKRSPNGRFA